MLTSAHYPMNWLHTESVTAFTPSQDRGVACPLTAKRGSEQAILGIVGGGSF